MPIKIGSVRAGGFGARTDKRTVEFGVQKGVRKADNKSKYDGGKSLDGHTNKLAPEGQLRIDHRPRIETSSRKIHTAEDAGHKNPQEEERKL